MILFWSLEDMPDHHHLWDVYSSCSFKCFVSLEMIMMMLMMIICMTILLSCLQSLIKERKIRRIAWRMRFNDESWTACVISSILSVSLPIPSSLFSNIKLTDERFFSHPRREPFFSWFCLSNCVCESQDWGRKHVLWEDICIMRVYILRPDVVLALRVLTLGYMVIKKPTVMIDLRLNEMISRPTTTS